MALPEAHTVHSKYHYFSGLVLMVRYLPPLPYWWTSAGRMIHSQAVKRKLPYLHNDDGDDMVIHKILANFLKWSLTESLNMEHSYVAEYMTFFSIKKKKKNTCQFLKEWNMTGITDKLFRKWLNNRARKLNHIILLLWMGSFCFFWTAVSVSTLTSPGWTCQFVVPDTLNLSSSNDSH